MKRENRCVQCGKPVVMSGFCLKHRIDQRERKRKQLGCKRRYYITLGYRLEAKAKAAARRKRRKKSR